MWYETASSSEPNRASAICRYRAAPASASAGLAAVHLGPLAAQLLGQLGPAAVGRLGDLPGQGQAALEVDPHAEEVGRRRRDDLGQAGGRAWRAVGHHGRAPGALQEHHRLEHVRVHPVIVRRLARSPRASPRCARPRRDATRARVDRAGCRAWPVGKLAALRGRPGQRIAEASPPPGGGPPPSTLTSGRVESPIRGPAPERRARPATATMARVISAAAAARRLTRTMLDG